MSKLKKKDMVEDFVDSLSLDQVQMVENLLGRITTRKTRISHFTKTFKKTLAISSRKGKARGLQQWAAQKISDALCISHGKDCEIQSREMGQSGIDVRMSKRVHEIFPFDIECKSHESWSIFPWIKQAIANCVEGHDWLLIMERKNRRVEDSVPPMVLMDGEAFFRLISKIFKPTLIRRRK